LPSSITATPTISSTSHCEIQVHVVDSESSGYERIHPRVHDGSASLQAYACKKSTQVLSMRSVKRLHEQREKSRASTRRTPRLYEFHYADISCAPHATVARLDTVSSARTDSAPAKSSLYLRIALDGGDESDKLPRRSRTKTWAASQASPRRPQRLFVAHVGQAGQLQVLKRSHSRAC
jgi:hypothetical protein